MNQVRAEKIREMWQRKRLSKAQIAAELNISPSAVTAQMHKAGLHGGTGKGRSTYPDNYRHHTPPYGYKIQRGKLVLNKSELKVCRLVVELVARQNKNHSETARELARHGFKNRAGNVKWDSKTVFNIFKRWNGKL